MLSSSHHPLLVISNRLFRFLCPKNLIETVLLSNSPPSTSPVRSIQHQKNLPRISRLCFSLAFPPALSLPSKKLSKTPTIKMSKRDEPEHPELKHPSTKRAKQVDADTPYDELLGLLESQESDQKVTKVVHWFRSKDLRIHDNRALHDASDTAKDADVPLIGIYLVCPADDHWHGTSPARVDFIFENLKLMQKELKDLDIPLIFLEAEERDQIVPTIIDFLKKQKVSHVFANFEYEVDELRRDIKVLNAGNKDGFRVSLRHDQCVVEPGTMLTGGNTPMKVFTPYHKAWLEEVRSNPSLLDTVPAPAKNSSNAKNKVSDLFGSTSLPTAPQDKQFASKDEQSRVRKLWSAGHKAAVDRLNHFIKTHLKDYANTRSNPALDTTSRLSPYLAAGVLSIREVCTTLKSHHSDSADFSSPPGLYSWVRELVFRELYRQTLLTTPHTSMNMPQNLKFDFVRWEADEEGWTKWKQGKTGMPFVDAGMRQLAAEKWMHNRLRMNVSSYLYTNLLLDYRRGERYFAETLVDWDLSNNTQGWEPSYTVFNPVSQAEKNDPAGEFIRRWVPELREVQGKAVFDPWGRLSKGEAEKLGYPRPHVDWKESKERALERFKRDMKDADP